MGTTELSRSRSALTLCCGAVGWERSLHLDLHLIGAPRWQSGATVSLRRECHCREAGPPVTHA
jgi:hypothetical protein